MWQRIYRGPYGTAAYQSVYQGGGHFIDLVHQVGIPGAAMLLLTAPLALISPWLGVPAALAAVGLCLLAAVDMARTQPAAPQPGGRTPVQGPGCRPSSAAADRALLGP